MDELDPDNVEKQLGFPCDINGARKLLELRAVPEGERGDDWLHELLETLPTAFLLRVAANAIHGPDNFHYIPLALLPPEGLKAGEKISPASVISTMQECLELGCGIVIFNDRSAEGEPFWVLNYGRLQSLKSYGSFYGDPVDLEEIQDNPEKYRDANTQEVVQEERETLIGAPSEEYLPALTRKILGEALDTVYGMPGLGVALMADMAHAPSRHLVLSLRAEDFKDEFHMNDVMNAVQWHLPPYRPIILNFGLEDSTFIPLK